MAASPSALAPIYWPEQQLQQPPLTRDWVLALGATLDAASRSLKPQELPSVVSVPVADAIIAAASKLMHREPNCLTIDPDPSCNVVLVGDVHGQLHDVLHLLEISGYPGPNQIYVFNGDYVDRGAWGFETYLLLLAWKILLPHRVFLLRGNHETKFCTSTYGFENEIMVKYGDQAKHLYRKILGCFEGHPLAAVIAGCVYMAHGGLFRHHEVATTKRGKGGKASKRLVGMQRGTLTLGTLEDLAKARRGVLDPSGVGSNIIPGDVLWSDPAPTPGLTHNVARGIGLLFGPDCTEEFMEKHKLKLIVRSHEGPDAREKRDDMADMEKGYTVDHIVKSGKLITLFSAPDYPQFQVSPYYDYLSVADSDEEIDLSSGSDYSGSSDLH
ncbi:hypothetical protein O6H91_06G108500 [Diphasiastrum complanatum]|uniref:Uncharacterized protein n=1 Tax=Diphasiastrum complanatum TaxID=34168 RepID=A0ACC2DHF1_DIPCM|nr:hypothetical protein O6H91_06G108500 [Diphasiastrum complanatum]